METKLTRRIRIRQARRERNIRVKSFICGQVKKTLALMMVMFLVASFVDIPSAYAYFTSKTGASEVITLQVIKDSNSTASSSAQFLSEYLWEANTISPWMAEEENFRSLDIWGLEEPTHELCNEEASEDVISETMTDLPELPVEITIEKEFGAEEIYIPSVELSYSGNSVAALYGEVKDGKLIVYFDRGAVLEWFGNEADRFQEVELTVGGKGYRQGLQLFEFSAPVQIILEEGLAQQGERIDKNTEAKDSDKEDTAGVPGEDLRKEKEEEDILDEEVLRPGKSVEIEVVDEVDSPVQIPEEEELFIQYEAVVFDYDGEEIETSKEVNWSYICSNAEKSTNAEKAMKEDGLTLSEDGELKITPEGETGVITIKASLSDTPQVEAQKPVMLVTDPQEHLPSFEELKVIQPEGPFYIPHFPEAQEDNYFNNYYFQAFMLQEDMDLLEEDSLRLEDLNWSVEGKPQGVYISEEGILSVGSEASAEELILEVALQDDSENHLEIEVELEPQPQELMPPEEVPFIGKEEEAKEIADDEDTDEDKDEREEDKDQGQEEDEKEDEDKSSERKRSKQKAEDNPDEGVEDKESEKSLPDENI